VKFIPCLFLQIEGPFFFPPLTPWWSRVLDRGSSYDLLSRPFGLLLCRLLRYNFAPLSMARTTKVPPVRPQLGIFSFLWFPGHLSIPRPQFKATFLFLDLSLSGQFPPYSATLLSLDRRWKVPLVSSWRRV